MGLMRRLVGLLPSDNVDGITRYYLSLVPNDCINVFVHKISPCEIGSLCHNHPWTFVLSFVLQGAYVEERYERGRRWSRMRKRFTTGVMTQDDFHRVARVFGETWTLFVSIGRSEACWCYCDEFGTYPICDEKK